MEAEKNKHYRHILQDMYELEQVPILLLKEGKIRLGSGMEQAPWLLCEEKVRDILQQEENGYYRNEPGIEGVYYGSFSWAQYVLLLGPMCTEPLNVRERQRLKRKYGLVGQELHVRMASRSKCRRILNFLYYLLTEDHLEDKHQEEQEEKRFLTQDRLLMYRYHKLDQTPHHSYGFEKQALEVIGSGNEEEVLRMLDMLDTEAIGQVAYTPQKSAEYMAVLMVSLTARVAIESGVSSSDAYALNDLYLQNISLCTELDGYTAIMKEAIRDFCRRIRLAKESPEASLLVVKSKDYISRHLNKDLSLEVLAKHVGVSEAYLSHAFSVQEDQTLHQYIEGERIRAAKNMLRFSDYSIAQVANYLGFSSQSYFGSVFRKRTGFTPLQFRKDQKKADSW